VKIDKIFSVMFLLLLLGFSQYSFCMRAARKKRISKKSRRRRRRLKRLKASSGELKGQIGLNLHVSCADAWSAKHYVCNVSNLKKVCHSSSKEFDMSIFSILSYAAFSRDGRLHAGVYDNQVLYICDVICGKQNYKILLNNRNVTQKKYCVGGVDFSPDNKCIAIYYYGFETVGGVSSGLQRKMVQVEIWDISSGERVKCFERICAEDLQPVSSESSVSGIPQLLKFSQDGRYIVFNVGCVKSFSLRPKANPMYYGQEICMIDIATEKEVDLFRQCYLFEQESVFFKIGKKSTVFSADGTYFASVCMGRSDQAGGKEERFQHRVCIWKDGNLLQNLVGYAKGITFSPDGKFFALVEKKEVIKIFKTVDWSVVKVFNIQELDPRCNCFIYKREMVLEFSPDGRHLLYCSSYGNRIYVLDVHRNKSAKKCSLSSLVPQSVVSVCFAPNAVLETVQEQERES